MLPILFQFERVGGLSPSFPPPCHRTASENVLHATFLIARPPARVPPNYFHQGRGACVGCGGLRYGLHCLASPMGRGLFSLLLVALCLAAAEGAWQGLMVASLRKHRRCMWARVLEPS